MGAYSRLGAYLRWVQIRGWALIRINTVISNQYFIIMSLPPGDGRGRGQAAKAHCFLIIHHDFYFQSKFSTVYVEAWKVI